MRISVAAALAFAVLLGACRRREQGVFVTAPFNDETRIAKVEAEWTPPAADGSTRFEVHVENRLADRLFIRLSNFRLTGNNGQPIAQSAARGECVLAADAAGIIVSGTVVLPPSTADRVRGFAVDSFGVPLSDRGRGIYREFLIQSKKHTEAEVDANLAAYAASPPCS